LFRSSEQAHIGIAVSFILKTPFFIVSVLIASLVAGLRSGGEGLSGQVKAEVRSGLITLRDDIPGLKDASREATAIPGRLYHEIGSDLESLAADVSADTVRLQRWTEQKQAEQRQAELGRI
jgi:hypothetical protein